MLGEFSNLWYPYCYKKTHLSVQRLNIDIFTVFFSIKIPLQLLTINPRHRKITHSPNQGKKLWRISFSNQYLPFIKKGYSICQIGHNDYVSISKSRHIDKSYDWCSHHRWDPLQNFDVINSRPLACNLNKMCFRARSPSHCRLFHAHSLTISWKEKMKILNFFINRIDHHCWNL